MIMFDRRTRTGRVALAACALASLSACSATLKGVQTQKLAPGEVPVQIGAPVRDNVTPMEGALACFAKTLSASGRRPLVVGVGDIKDFTGRYSINEGNVVTQGGSLMLFSALGKLGGTVRIAERFDSTIAERELGYMDRRQLGNGEAHDVNGQKVPWLPYFGGTIQVSDYYIAGGISEVNYNISSGGAEASINNIGIKRRTYTQSVAVDLRIVDTRTLLVVDAISLSKQFSGYEVGANTFRFFGLGLADINVGQKGQEPLQLGIRAAIEEAAIRLIGRVTNVDPAPCLALRTSEIQTETSEQLFAKMAHTGQPSGVARNATPPTGMPQPANARMPAPAPASSPAPERAIVPPPVAAGQKPTSASGKSLNALSSGGQGAPGRIVQIPFEIGDAKLAGPAQAIIDGLSGSAGEMQIVLVTRESEKLDPAQRGRLIDQRIASLVMALRNRGIPPKAISLTWRPDPTDATIYRDGPGVQLLARLKITK